MPSGGLAGTGREVRPEVPRARGEGGVTVTAVPRGRRGCCGDWGGEAAVASLSASRRRAGCYSAALASAPSALPSTSSSEQSPAPFRPIRRGTTNGRSPRLEAEAARCQQGRPAAMAQLTHFKATFREKLAPTGEAPGASWATTSRKDRKALRAGDPHVLLSFKTLAENHQEMGTDSKWGGTHATSAKCHPLVTLCAQQVTPRDTTTVHSIGGQASPSGPGEENHYHILPRMSAPAAFLL